MVCYAKILVSSINWNVSKFTADFIAELSEIVSAKMFERLLSVLNIDKKWGLRTQTTSLGTTTENAAFSAAIYWRCETSHGAGKKTLSDSSHLLWMMVFVSFSSLSDFFSRFSPELSERICLILKSRYLCKYLLSSRHSFMTEYNSMPFGSDSFCSAVNSVCVFRKILGKICLLNTPK